jgi:hypothetical protein
MPGPSTRAGHLSAARSPIRGVCAAVVCALLAFAALTHAGAAAVAARAGTSASGDQGDLWWNAGESGWGLQLAHTADILFATLYVYDAAERPTFFTATLAQDGASSWTGDVYRTTGPHWAAPAFDPARVNAQRVGTMRFRRVSETSGELTYVIDGVAVVKAVQRQPLRNDDLGGTYRGTLARTAANCPDPARNVAEVQAIAMRVTHDRGVMQMEWAWADGASCRYVGAYVQQGRVGTLAATYECTDGEAGEVSFHDMTLRSGILSGRFAGHAISNGCDRAGQFTGLVPP